MPLEIYAQSLWQKAAQIRKQDLESHTHGSENSTGRISKQRERLSMHGQPCIYIGLSHWRAIAVAWSGRARTEEPNPNPS